MIIFLFSQCLSNEITMSSVIKGKDGVEMRTKSIIIQHLVLMLGRQGDIMLDKGGCLIIST